MRQKEWDGRLHPSTKYPSTKFLYFITRGNMIPVPSFFPKTLPHPKSHRNLRVFIQIVGVQCFTKDSPFTTSCTSVCACPKMFVAEHWYSPECLAFTFFNSNLPLETADVLTWERLSLLLHTTAGSGLPLTEH